MITRAAAVLPALLGLALLSRATSAPAGAPGAPPAAPVPAARAQPAVGVGVSVREGVRVLRVGRGGPHATVAEALAVAGRHDTIVVAAGWYRGPLLIDRPVVLLGEPGAVLDGDRLGNAVTLRADSVVLRGFTIVESGRSLDRDHAAVRVERCFGCRVSENRIERSLHGIYLLEARSSEVSGNTIVGDTLLPEARRGNGIHLFHASGNRIRDNVIRYSRDGIYFSFSTHTDVRGNDVQLVRYGLHYMYSDDNHFFSNRFARNAAGAALMFSKRIVFEENTFADHVGYRAYGILLQTADEIRARRNRITGNLVGIFLDMSSRNEFRENLIAGNGTAVDVLASAEENLFTENAIVANRRSVRLAGGGVTHWSAAGRGNYWGVAEVFDLDGDGIGDRPYRVGDPFSSLAALRPALEAFSGTPAAKALAWAEEAFPVFDLPRAVDAHPLVAVPAAVPGGIPARGRVAVLSRAAEWR